VIERQYEEEALAHIRLLRHGKERIVKVNVTEVA
jgi:hypothetical protein